MQAVANEKLAALYESNHVEKYNIDQRIRAAHYRLLTLDGSVDYKFPVLPEKLIREWEDFPTKHGNNLQQSNKIAYGELVKKTLQYLEYIKSLPRENKVEPKNVRTMSGEQIQTDLKRLEPLLQTAMQKLDEAKRKEHPDKDEIDYWDSVVKEYQAKVLTLRGDQKAHESDKKSEEEWEGRLTTSFEELDKKSSRLSYDIIVARIEYFVCIILMIVSTILFLCWYHSFYESLTARDSTIHITTWISNLPYALPATAYIAVMWILIVQKNRANKISISLSTRLANIHYLEGLMKLVNRLSQNSETAVGRINGVVGKMIDSYLRQLETSNVTETKIEAIEKKAEDDVPQKKMFNELKNILHD